jgi:hypothetical protein
MPRRTLQTTNARHREVQGALLIQGREQEQEQEEEEEEKEAAVEESESSESVGRLPGYVDLTRQHSTPSTVGTSSVATSRSAAGGSKTVGRLFELVSCEYETLEGSIHSGGVFLCMHCRAKKWNWWSGFNSTKARHHLLQCGSTPESVCEIMEQAGTKNRRAAVDDAIITAATNSEASASHKRKRLQADARFMKKHTTLYAHRSILELSTARTIIKANVEASLAAFQPPLRGFTSPYNKAFLVAACGHGILPHLPSAETIWLDYIDPIDKEVEEYLMEMMRSSPGSLGVSFDGVSVLGRSSVLYTITKGDITLFVTVSHLGDVVHNHADEIAAAVSVLGKMRKKLGCSISNAAVDNGAASVCTQALTMYASQYPDEPKILVTRDPCHCVDLIAKDLIKIQGMVLLDKSSRSVINLLNRDRIQGITERAYSQHKITSHVRVAILSETRFYGNADMLIGLRKNRSALGILETLDEYKAYYESRTAIHKREIEEVLQVLSSGFWKMVDFAIDLFDILKTTIMHLSSERMPMSAYLPLVQAMKNELESILQSYGRGWIDEAFGEGCFEAIEDIIGVRFNMDGKKPCGTTKVGLLDKYQLWAFIVDPFRKYLEVPIALGPSDDLHEYFCEALDFYLPPESSTPELRTNVQKEFQQIISRTGRYQYLYHTRGQFPHHDGDPEQLQQSLTVDMVMKWVKTYGEHNGRLEFFSETRSKYYSELAKPLLSMKTMGSISVERVAKSLKNRIATKERNRLSNHKRTKLLRVGLNLCLKMRLSLTNSGVMDYDPREELESEEGFF